MFIVVNGQIWDNNLAGHTECKSLFASSIIIFFY